MAELTLNTSTITDMSELARLVYLEYGTSIKIGDEYFASTDITDTETNVVENFYLNSRYTVIETTGSEFGEIGYLSSMQAMLLKNEDTGEYVIAFRGTQESGDYLTDFIIGLTSAVTGTGAAYNAQYSAADEFVTDMVAKYSDLSLSNLTLTGHSLGGILAQTIASENSMSAYTFNALGTSGLTRFNDTNGSKILNFSYTDDGNLNGDILSNALSFAGNEHLGEVVTMFGPNIGIAAHKMENMTMVIDVYNTILNSFNSDTDYRDVSKGFRSNINIAKHSYKDTFFKTAEYLAELEIYEAGVSDLKYNFLTEMTAYELQQNAINNRAAMFAILKLNGFAVEGNLTAYADMDLKTYSDKYVEMRSTFLFYLLDTENRYEPLGSDAPIFKDMEGTTLYNDTFLFENTTSDRVIFDSDSTISRYSWSIAATTDGNNYLFGMGGDDVLFGGSGNDYLEGGEGKDTLIGGGGFDTYVAGDGDRLYDSGLGDGKVFFEDSELYDGSASTKGHALSGGVQISEGSNIYRGDGGEYELINNTLLFTRNEKTVTIGGYSSGNLGITLTKLSDSGGDTGGSDGSGGSDTGSGGTGTDDGTTDTEDETVYATPQDDILILTNENDTMDGLAGDDYIEGKAGNDILIGNTGDDILWGGTDDDMLYGDEGSDILFGDTGADYLEGGSGDDMLYGGDGDDVLLGGEGSDYLNGGDISNLYTEKESDYLLGGTGFDTYFVSHQDVINDADSDGLIMFNDKSLNGKKTKIDEYTYEDENFTYTLDGNNLLVVDKNLVEYITIEYFQNGAMSIELNNEEEQDDPTKKDVEIYVGNATVTEGGTLEFTVGIDNTLENDLTLSVGSYFNGSADSNDLLSTTSGTITIKAGTTSGAFAIDTVDDTLISKAGDDCLTCLVIFQKNIQIKNNINNYINLSTYYKSLDVVNKHFYIYKYELTYVAYNNREYKIQREVA